jgi:hypothetical protein
MYVVCALRGDLSVRFCQGACVCVYACACVRVCMRIRVVSSLAHPVNDLFNGVEANDPGAALVFSCIFGLTLCRGGEGTVLRCHITADLTMHLSSLPSP